MLRSLEMEVKVGIFVSLGVVLIMIIILSLGSGQSVFEGKSTYTAKFGEIEGLIEGAAVKISGIRAGQVTKITFLKDSAQVQLSLSILNKYAGAIRQDSTVGIQTQGVMGDRYIVITPGSQQALPLADGGEIRAEAPKDLKSYLTDADEVLDRLKKSLGHMEGILGSFDRDQRADTFFRNMASVSSNANDGTKDMKASMAHLKSIITKVDNGEGTLGALINDPSLFDDMKALIGGANRSRVLKYFVRKSVEESREAAGKK